MSRDPCPTASGKARPISDRLWSISMRADASARCLVNLNRAIGFALASSTMFAGSQNF